MNLLYLCALKVKRIVIVPVAIFHKREILFLQPTGRVEESASLTSAWKFLYSFLCI